MIRNLGNWAFAALKTAWEKDLNLTLDNKDWESICKNIKALSREAKICLIQETWANKLAKCWKCGTEGGHLIHRLRSCDRIQQFWLRIYANICEVLETQTLYHLTPDYLC